MFYFFLRIKYKKLLSVYFKKGINIYTTREKSIAYSIIFIYFIGMNNEECLNESYKRSSLFILIAFEIVYNNNQN